MTVQTPPPKASMSLEEVIARGQALADALAPQAAEAENLRRMPPGFAQKVIDSQLMTIVRPARYGGIEGDWQMVAEALRPMGRVSGSMTWCLGFLIQHQFVLSHFPIETQDAVYGQHPDPLVVTSFAPGGKVERVDGGWKVSGEWSFGSGGDHCDWAVTGVMIPQEGGPPQIKWMLFKPGQFWMRDVWQSAGLKGSGSNNIVVEDAFVEDAYAVDMFAAMSGRHPSRGLSSHPIFNTGIGPQFQFGLTTPLTAVADGLLDSFLGFFRDKVSYMGVKKSASPPLQLRVGESAAELAAARTVLYNLNSKVMAGQMTGPNAGTEFLRDIGLIARLVLGASDRLFTMSGARGLDEGNLFGRHWRDVHAICNHGALQADGFFTNYGALVLNGPEVEGGH